MNGILKGPRPDLTPAQIVGIIFLVISNGLVFVGIDIGPAREEALERIRDGVIGLLAVDLGLRGVRNYADAKITAAGITKNGTSSALASGAPPLEVDEDDFPGGLVDDDEELASPPPIELTDPSDLSDEERPPAVVETREQHSGLQ